jgi:hypothetical protein
VGWRANKDIEQKQQRDEIIPASLTKSTESQDRASEKKIRMEEILSPRASDSEDDNLEQPGSHRNCNSIRIRPLASSNRAF